MNRIVALDPILCSTRVTMFGNALVVKKQLVKILIRYSTMSVTAIVLLKKINVQNPAPTIVKLFIAFHRIHVRRQKPSCERQYK